MRYDLNQLFANSRTPQWSSFHRRISCSTVSKALRFTNISQPIFPLSRACLMFSVKFINTWVVEKSSDKWIVLGHSGAGLNKNNFLNQT